MTVCLLTAGDTEEFSVLVAVILYNLTLKTHQPVLTQHSCASWLEEEVGGCWWEWEEDCHTKVCITDAESLGPLEESVCHLMKTIHHLSKSFPDNPKEM